MYNGKLLMNLPPGGDHPLLVVTKSSGGVAGCLDIAFANSKVLQIVEVVVGFSLRPLQ
jgi:hypothetical protein